LQKKYLNNPDIAKYTYLTHDDFKELTKTLQSENKVIIILIYFLKGDALFIITAPKGTIVEAPVPESSTSEYPYQLYLNSSKVPVVNGNSNEISVYICQDETFPIEYEKKEK